MITETLALGSCWALLIASSACLGVYRSLIDRIRSGLSPAPSDEHTRVAKVITKALSLPNHERPFHFEAAFLSSLQILSGFFLLKIWMPITSLYWALFLLSILVERISTWLYPRRISQSKALDSHLKIGLLPVLFFTLVCKPIVILLSLLEHLFLSSKQKKILEEEEDNEVADHIRIIGREGTNLDPDVLEIMGNTLEMSQLKIKDVMIPRNQVQILDFNDSFEKNLEIAKSCGHTRLPLCDDDLDRCLGIIHVKYAFRKLNDRSNSFDLRKITKAPALLSKEEPLPVALKRMMKLKVHMALVRDEFGGIDGVITLEDILEEVVGEIQDEFDADEKPIEKISENKWRVSGMVPVHDLPEEIKHFEQEDDMATVGGIVTGELGRIPETGEIHSLNGMKIKILEADDTRLLSLEIEFQEMEKDTTSEETI